MRFSSSIAAAIAGIAALSAPERSLAQETTARIAVGVDQSVSAVRVFDAVVAASPDWVESPWTGSSYRLTAQSTWAEAEAEAQAAGGHLASVDDAFENQWILDTFGSVQTGIDALWIGLNDASQEGSFEWTSGQSLGYENWFPGEPNNDQGDESFVCMYNNFSPRTPGTWNDNRPDVTYPGVIEVNGPPPTDTQFVQVGEFIAFHPRVEGARVAVGDVNNDGYEDIIVGAGAGGRGEVKVVDGTRLNDVDSHGIINPSALLADYFAFGRGFRHDVNVASGDVDNDGFDDVIVGAGPGSKPLVRVYDGALLNNHDRSGHNALVASFLAFDSHFRGGVSVAAGDQNADGFADIIVGARSNSISTVNVFDGSLIGIEEQDHNHNLSQLLARPKIIAILIGFTAYPDSFTGGVLVASARGITDGTSNTIVTGPSKPGDGTVKVFGAGGASQGAPKALLPYVEQDNLRIFGPSFIGGVRVAAGDIDGDGIDEVLGASSAGTGYEDTINIGAIGEGGLTSWGSFKPFGSKFVSAMEFEFAKSGFFVGSKSTTECTTTYNWVTGTYVTVCR